MYQPINGYTKQSMIERIQKGNTGRQAYQEGTCRYLTESGNKCVIGCFIPDGHEGQNFVGSVDKLIAKYPDLADSMPLFFYFLGHLQLIHDRCGGDPRPKLVEWINENVI